MWSLNKKTGEGIVHRIGTALCLAGLLGATALSYPSFLPWGTQEQKPKQEPAEPAKQETPPAPEKKPEEKKEEAPPQEVKPEETPTPPAPAGGEAAPSEVPAPPPAEGKPSEAGKTEPPPATEEKPTEGLPPAEGAKPAEEAAPKPPQEESLPSLEEIEPLTEEAKPAEEKPAEAAPAEPPPAEEKPEEGEKPSEAPPAEPEAAEEKGVTFWNEKIRVRGIGMARVIRAWGNAEPFSGTTIRTEPSPFVRYITNRRDGGATLYDVAHLGLSLAADFTPNVRGYVHVGYNPSLTNKANYNVHYQDTGRLHVFELYARMKIPTEYFKQAFYVRVGRIAPLRLSREHETPMRTSKYFVTPSPISAFVNNLYGQGADISYGFERGKNPIGGWAFGVIEGNYFYTLPIYQKAAKHYWPVTDVMTSPGSGNAKMKGRPGAYAYFTVREGSGHYRLSGAYYWNGVRDANLHGHTLRLSTGSVEAHWKYATLIYQMVNAQTLFRTPVKIQNPFVIGPAPTLSIPMLTYDGFYFLLHIPVGEHHGVSVRYDEFTVRYASTTVVPATSNAYVINYTFSFLKRHSVALEHVFLDTREWSLTSQDAKDSFTVLNYTFSF